MYLKYIFVQKYLSQWKWQQTSKATGSLYQPLNKIDVSIRANSVFSQYMYRHAAGS